MKIELRFLSEPEDDGQGITQLAGKMITMEHVEVLDNLSVSVDVFDGPLPGQKLPGKNGHLKIDAYGPRALWSDIL